MAMLFDELCYEGGDYRCMYCILVTLSCFKRNASNKSPTSVAGDDPVRK